MERNDLEVTRMSHFVGIGLVLGFLLPHTSTAFLLVNPLLCLFYQCFRQNRILYKYNWIVLAPILLTLFINFPQGVSQKAIISNLTLILYFYTFPMVGRVKIQEIYFYLILVVVVLSQLAYVLGIPLLVDFLNTYYPFSEDNVYYSHLQNTITRENYMNFRLGGLYRNPNQCSRSLTFLLAAYLALNKDKTIRRMLPFVVICFYGVLLTGSRTGFIIASLLFVTHLFFDKKVNEKVRYLIVFILIAIFVYLVSGGASIRSLEIVNTGSSDAKFNTFSYYLSMENSLIKILFGYLESTRFDSVFGIMDYFDSDYGYLIFQYGFVGFSAIILYYYTVFKRVDKRSRVFFILMLWMLTSTIVTSYRAVFIFTLLLSIVYGNRKQEICYEEDKQILQQ